jgi:putative SOS response-associated peptidase YedK
MALCPVRLTKRERHQHANLGEWPIRGRLRRFDTVPRTAGIGAKPLDVMRWGLVPFCAKDIKVGFSNINAKAEGIEGKPAFREAFQRRHCFVPVDNFYDCKKATGGKRPYAIAFADPQRS